MDLKFISLNSCETYLKRDLIDKFFVFLVSCIFCILVCKFLIDFLIDLAVSKSKDILQISGYKLNQLNLNN